MTWPRPRLTALFLFQPPREPPKTHIEHQVHAHNIHEKFCNYFYFLYVFSSVMQRKFEIGCPLKSTEKFPCQCLISRFEIQTIYGSKIHDVQKAKFIFENDVKNSHFDDRKSLQRNEQPKTSGCYLAKRGPAFRLKKGLRFNEVVMQCYVWLICIVYRTNMPPADVN